MKIKKLLTVTLALTLFSNALYGQSFYIREKIKGRLSSRFIEFSFDRENGEYVTFQFCDVPDVQEDLSCKIYHYPTENLERVIESILENNVSVMRDETSAQLLWAVEAVIFALLTAAFAISIRTMSTKAVLSGTSIFGSVTLLSMHLHASAREQLFGLEKSSSLLNFLEDGMHDEGDENDRIFSMAVDDLDETWKAVTDLPLYQ